MALPVTGFYGGLLGLWMVFLTLAVIHYRRTRGVSLGATDTGGERIVRAHGNAAETIPLFLILMALAEGLGTSTGLLHVMGLAMLAGRIMHGYNFLRPRRVPMLRVWGMALTLIGLILASVQLVRVSVFG